MSDVGGVDAGSSGLRWRVYLGDPEPPAGVPTPWGSGNTPDEALASLRRQVEFDRDRSTVPLAYFDDLLLRLNAIKQAGGQT